MQEENYKALHKSPKLFNNKKKGLTETVLEKS